MVYTHNNITYNFITIVYSSILQNEFDMLLPNWTISCFSIVAERMSIMRWITLLQQLGTGENQFRDYD